MATGVTRVSERQLNGRLKVDWRVLVAFALQLFAFGLAYGRLNQKVDDLRDEMREVKQQLVLLRAGK